jgi:hypothetical protein
LGFEDIAAVVAKGERGGGGLKPTKKTEKSLGLF